MSNFSHIKVFLYRHLPTKVYLTILHYAFVVLYNLRILYFFPQYKQHYEVKRYLQKWNTVLDIGANLGHYTHIFSKSVGWQWKVYAVEPVLDFCNVILRVFQNKGNIDIIPKALWSYSGEVTLAIKSHDKYMRTWLPQIVLEWDRCETFQHIFSSYMEKGSEIFATLPKIHYIKIDVEWYEMNILYDLKEIIQKHQPILQVETSNVEQFLSYIRDIQYTLDESSCFQWDFIALPQYV